MESPKKRKLFSVAIFSLAFALLGLTGSAEAQEPLTVGVLIPGSISDHGWMESGYVGMKKAEKRFGKDVKVSYISNISMGQMQQALTNLASSNKLVIGVGGQTQAALLRVAKRFPNVNFTVIGGSAVNSVKNVATYDVRQAQIAFVAGAGAAMLSKTHVVNYIGGLQIPAIVNAGKEFAAGAKYAVPKTKVILDYTGNFDDVVKAKQAELVAISQGSDISYNILNLGVRGMEEAAKEKGTHMIGSYTNYCGTDPLYIAYTITGVGYEVEYAIKKAVEGAWKSGNKPFGLMMGQRASGFVICGETPIKVRAKILQIEQDLLTGKIKTLDS